MTTILAALQAIIALPQILKELSGVLLKIQEANIDRAVNRATEELRSQVIALAKAKTNEEIAAAIRALNNRG